MTAAGSAGCTRDMSSWRLVRWRPRTSCSASGLEEQSPARHAIGPILTRHYNRMTRPFPRPPVAVTAS